MAQTKQQKTESVSAAVVGAGLHSRPSEICEALDKAIAVIERIRQDYPNDAKAWAKEELPWPLSLLISNKVAQAVLAGLEGALQAWRSLQC